MSEKELWTRLCASFEIEEGKIKQYKVEDIDVIVMRSKGVLSASQAICPHMDEPLKNGLLKNGKLTCMKHLWQWDVATGEKKGLAEQNLCMYDVMEQDGSVYININGDK